MTYSILDLSKCVSSFVSDSQPTMGLTLLDSAFPEIIDTDMDSQFSLFIETLATTLDDHNNTTALTESSFYRQLAA